MYCNHMLLAGFIKISLFTHSQEYFKSRYKGFASAHTRTRKDEPKHPTDTDLHWLQPPISLSCFSLLISLMRLSLPCRDCALQMHEQVFPPKEMQSKCESNMTALPHNQTPHPQLHTTTSVGGKLSIFCTRHVKYAGHALIPPQL